MKNTSKVVIFLIITFLHLSCDSFISVDNKVNSFVQDIESRKSTMTELDWEQADMAIEDFKKELDEKRSSLTDSQIQEANKAIGRYAGIRLKKGIGDFKEQLKDIGSQLEGVINELSDTTNK